jgi:solute carrier family 25 (adenine nucleotide translocator) protein 4/5/6/31
MLRPREKSAYSFAVDFALGGVSAAVCKTVAGPIERVRLLIQNQGEMQKQGRLDKPYNGIKDCFTRVAKDEGVLSLWRGNLTNVLRYFPTQALNFAFKDQFKKMLAVPTSASKSKKFAANIASGGLAGATSLIFVYPLEYARTRLSNNVKGKEGERQFNGIRDVFAKTYNADGIRGLYRGFATSFAGIFVYRGLYFGLYDTLKPTLGPLQHNMLANFMLGWGITISAGLAFYPFDTICRRMMMSSAYTEKYTSSIACLRSIVRTEGVPALFKGAGANILRSIAGAGVLAVYDRMQLLFFGIGKRV